MRKWNNTGLGFAMPVVRRGDYPAQKPDFIPTMTSKPLVFFLSLALVSCSAKKPPVTIVKVGPETAPAVTEIAVDSWKHKIIEAATEEWIFFGQQKVIIEKDEESIPHVGAWEDDDFSHSERVNRYWRTVGMSRLSGKDCKQPWSAAFISWVMQEAGVSEGLFPPAASHRDYLSHFLAVGRTPGAVFIPHTIQEYKPKPGDLICANRGEGYFGEVVEELPLSLNAKLHCDIVAQVDGRFLYAIGGNVRNSVSKSILTLTSDGYLQMTQHRPWFMVIENRLD